jgi:drug/metabolite transporter (DMT)-like permease
MASAAGFLLMTWCVHKRGPVFTAAFIPIVQIMVAVIDFFFLHEQLYLGRYCACIYVSVQLYVPSIHASAMSEHEKVLNFSLSKQTNKIQKTAF